MDDQNTTTSTGAEPAPVAADPVAAMETDNQPVAASEERRESKDDGEAYRHRRRSNSRSQSPRHQRSRTPRRSRSPRRGGSPSARRSRSPRTPPRDGPGGRRTSEHYDDRKDGGDRRERERDLGRRDRSRSRDSRSASARGYRERSYSQRVAAMEVAALAASQRSQKDCRVYVGNLAYEVKWGQLKDFMRKAGEVVFADVLLQGNGMSKGCGVVEYRTAEEARRAIETLNDTQLLGRPVFIREDREKEAKFGNVLAAPRGGTGTGHHSDNRGNTGRQIFVGNLPWSVGWQELKDLFRNAGAIIRADILIGHDRRSKGSGTVLFETPADASNAISMYDGYEWNGRRIEVREDRFAGGPPPPRFSGRSRPYGGASSSYNQNGPTHGGGGGGGFYSGGGGGSGGYPSNYGSGLGPGAEQYDTYGAGGGGYGGGGGGYGEYGAGAGGGGMMDYGPGGFAGGFGGGPYGAVGGYDGGAPGFYGGGGVGAALAGGAGANGAQIFVRNLPYNTTNVDLRDLFKHCGNVIRAEILEHGGRPKGAGIVQFDIYDSARAAVEKFSGYLYGGRPLDVHFDRFA